MTRTQHPQFSFLGDALLRHAARAGAVNVALQLQGRGDDPFWPDAADSAFYDALRSGNGVARQMLHVAYLMNRELPDLRPYLEVALDNNDNAAITQLLQFLVELKSLMPFTLLAEAIATNNVRRIAVLVTQRSISVALQDNDSERTVIHFAINRGSAETLGFLLDRMTCRERAARLCATREATGDTALHRAVASGEIEKLRLILDFDPGVQARTGSINVANRVGKTPFALAFEAGRADMVHLMRRRIAPPLGGS